MATDTLFRRIGQAERKLTGDVEAAEQARIALIEAHQGTVRKRVKEALEETPEMQEARENVERLQLRLELLRNIKMNWRGFQASLTRRGMNMRINQHAHLEHLIAFLETGHGVAIGDEDEVDTEPDPTRALMTHEIQPTGAGKTGAFAIDIALMDVPSLTLVPFDSLLDQTKKDMVKIGSIPEDQIGLVGGGTKEIGRKHTIATYAGHAALMRKGGEYAEFMKTQCKLVICDEVHHQALGDRMQESIREIDTLSNGEPTEEEIEMLEAERDVVTHLTDQTGVKSLKIGFTATPRGSQKHVRQFFPHCLGRVYHREMVEAGLVVPFRIVQCDGSVAAGELDEYMSQDKEAEIMEREGIYGKLAGEYADVLSTYGSTKRRSEDMPMYGMAFCTNHKECEKFVEEAEEHGLRCRIVTGKEAKGRAGQAVINAAVDALIAGEIDLIVTVEKLATGFNRPEINGIISARITSAAKTIQYIGRGARSHTDTEQRVKQHCHVFETNWTLKRNAKRGKKPLRLADALAFNGEDPEAVCSMADGSSLGVERTYKLEENGTLDVGGRLAVGISMYAKNKTPKIDTGTLQKYVDEAELQPVQNIKVYSGPRPIEVYWKDEVDALIPKRLDERGIVDIDGREAIGIEPYAACIRPPLGSTTLARYIKDHGLKKIPNVRVLSGTAGGIDIYWKDEVDALIPKRLDERGIVDIDGREAIGIVPYARSLKPALSRDALRKYIEGNNLKKIPNVRVLGGTKPVDIYWKDEVDALIPKRLDERGIVDIDGREAVALKAYARHLGGIDILTIRKYVTQAELTIVQNTNILSGTSPVEVYWKEEVDAVLRDQGRF